MIKAKYIVGNAKKVKQIFKRYRLGNPQLVISSPPYYDVKNYENHEDQIGYGQGDYDTYINEVAQVFQDCYDISTTTASFWLIIDSFKKEGEVLTLPFDINNKLKQNQEKTWLLKEIIIWDKEKGLPWNGKGFFKNEFEYILFFTKSDEFKFNIDRVREINDLKKWWLSYPERYNPQGKAPSNVWSFTTPIRGWGNGKQNHLCPFPFPLVEKLISIASDKDDLVFDPFAGSGSVLAMAEQMNRRGIGVDINSKYKVLFNKEVKSGAKAYWIKRTTELKKNKRAIIDFATTNNKLRILKVAASIANHINDQNSNRYLHFLIAQNNETTILTINSDQLKINLDSDEKLRKLIRQAKVNLVTKVITKIELFDSISEDTILYKYDLEKFYSFQAKLMLKTVMDGSKDRYDFIYSNIELKIY
ncbi:MAG TPA: site-specific DNA-methyltransferase [bacterium]|nr:site-specific DNA-methyltransferase [bacterium]